MTEFLAKSGITPHGYNVVMQGDITRIIEMSDFERRKIIDEIAGVSEFDAKKEQAIRELEVVRERIEREELLLARARGPAHRSLQGAGAGPDLPEMGGSAPHV